MNDTNPTQRKVIIAGVIAFIVSCVAPPIYYKFLGIPLEFLGMKWGLLWDLSDFSAINMPRLVVEWAIIAAATFGLCTLFAGNSGGWDGDADGGELELPPPNGSRPDVWGE